MDQYLIIWPMVGALGLPNRLESVTITIARTTSSIFDPLGNLEGYVDNVVSFDIPIKLEYGPENRNQFEGTLQNCKGT